MLNSLNVRPAQPSDVEQIKQLALDNHMFEPEEICVFDEMLAGFFDGSLEGHQWVVATTKEEPQQLAAAAYYAPEPFSDRMWNLYFIATNPSQHGSGAGTTLIERVESNLRQAGADAARTLIVDTSSLGAYDQARSFYDRRGFVEEACVRDFYGPGDNKVTFWKSLTD